MKYIRTKNEIFDTGIMNGELTAKQEKEIIQILNPHYKVAETIEELCDEWVVIYPTGERSSFNCEDIKTFCENWNIDIELDEIYGAIWTDKGLIFVAKMNDKGELNLL